MTDEWEEERGPAVLRAAVMEAADRPIGQSPDIMALTARVRGRRRRRALIQAGGATVAAGVVSVAVAIPFGGQGTRQPMSQNTNTSGPSSTSGPPNFGTAVAPPSSAAVPNHPKQPDLPGVVCGQRFTAQYEDQAPGGVRLAVSGVHPTGTSTAPQIDVALSAGQAVRVSGSVLQLGIQVVVLRDGVVVDRIGGALWPDDAQPAANEPGGQGAGARSWSIDVGQPHTERIASSHWTACPGVDWSALHADPGAYQIMAIMPMPMVYGPDGPLGGTPEGYLGSIPTALS